jgi:hypothetical protein
MGGAEEVERSLLRKGWYKTCCVSCWREVFLRKSFREVEAVVGVRKAVKVEGKLTNSS